MKLNLMWKLNERDTRRWRCVSYNDKFLLSLHSLILQIDHFQDLIINFALLNYTP